MRLVVESGDNRVVALDNLETYLTPATGGIAIERVGEVLRALREAASAIKAPTLSPQELENISSVIFASAGHAYALAMRAPEGDPDAPAVLEMLRSLGLAPGGPA